MAVNTPLTAHFRFSVTLSPQPEEEHISCVPYTSAVGSIMYTIVYTRFSVTLSPQPEEEHISCVPYTSAVGSIMYTIVCTHSNISHVVM